MTTSCRVKLVCLLLYSLDLIGFYILKWGNQKNILWHMKTLWNSDFSAHTFVWKWPHSFVYALSAFTLQQCRWAAATEDGSQAKLLIVWPLENKFADSWYKWFFCHFLFQNDRLIEKFSHFFVTTSDVFCHCVKSCALFRDCFSLTLALSAFLPGL